MVVCYGTVCGVLVHSFIVKYVVHTSLSKLELIYMLFVRTQQCCGQSAPAVHLGSASAAGPSADLPVSRATGFPARETGSCPAVPAHPAAATLGPGHQLQNVSMPTRPVFLQFFTKLAEFRSDFLEPES
jgi:hypothetical protein